MASRRLGAVTRIGVLIPHADVGPESELQAMAPPSVVIHAARAPFGAMGAGGVMDPTIPHAPVLAFAEPPGVDEAVALLAAAPVQAIGYAFTSSAYLIGAAGEAAMVARQRERAGDIPVTAACAAAVEALRALEVSRLALVHPPWFDPELAARGAGTSALRDSRSCCQSRPGCRATSAASSRERFTSGCAPMCRAARTACSSAATASARWA